METALFFRKCPNSDEYFKLAKCYSHLGSNLNFKILKTIKLSHDDYSDFKTNFLKDNNDIIKMTNDLYMDDNDCVHCAFFTEDEISGFLVYSSGYGYARYIAYYQIKERD